MNLTMEVADMKIYLADARRELAYIRIELANKKIQDIGYRAIISIIITLPPQNAFINPTNVNGTKANYLVKLPDIPEYISERDNLEPWIMQLKIKLEKNADYYLMMKSELFYTVSQFKGRAMILV